MNTQTKLAHPFWHRDARTNPSSLQWGDPLKQQERMARLIAGLKKRRVWKDVSCNRPCKQLHSFLIYEPTLWKKSVFQLKVWLLGMDKQNLLVRGKPEMLAKKAKQASTGRTIPAKQAKKAKQASTGRTSWSSLCQKLRGEKYSYEGPTYSNE